MSCLVKAFYCVPKLQSYGLVVHLHLLDQELHAHCHIVGIRELVLHISQDQARFPDGCFIPKIPTSPIVTTLAFIGWLVISLFN